MMPRTTRIVQDPEDADLFITYEGDEKTGPSLSRENVEHLARITAEALGWETGPNLNLNLSNIPTRAQLYEAVAKSAIRTPFPVLDRMSTSLTILEQYSSWLPDNHRQAVERDIRYIARRLEDLILCFELMRDFRDFSGLPCTPSLARDMFYRIDSFVRKLKETTGTELWP